MKFFKLFASCFIVLFILYSNSNAQNSFSPGYHILNSGDTVDGWIRVSKYTPKTQTIDFKQHENADEKILNPSETKGICIVGKRRFTSEYKPGKDFEKQKYFFEEIIQGVVSLYFFPDQNNKNHLYIKKDGELILISNNSVEIQPDLLTYEIDNLFRRPLMYYLNECDKIQPTINSTTYTIKSMTRLIKKYHECLNLEYTIENEKDLKQKLSIGIISLVNQSSLSYTSRPTPDNDAYIENNFKSNMYMSFGLFLKLSSTKVSPRMAIVFEPTIYQLEYTDKKNDDNVSQKYLSFQIPLIVSYNLIGKSKNSMPLEIGVSYTSILNNPQSSTQYSPILTANFDFIGGLNYNFVFSNTKQLGIHLRYYYGISNVYQPYNYTGKRNRFGLGLSYELFKN